jgi:uncharacterized protein YggE
MNRFLTASHVRTIAFSTLGMIIMNAATQAQHESSSNKIEPTISVSGTGKVTAVPDLADIQVGVVTQAQTARDALSANNEAMNALTDVLKKSGVAAKDIQTTQISVQPQYSQPRPPRPGEAPPTEFVPRIVGYQVTNMVQITAREIGKLGAILDAVVTAGANQIHGISFRIDGPEKLLDVARKQAMADARRKAEQLAGEAGVIAGPPLLIREEGGMIPTPQPRMMGRMMMAEAAGAAPVAPGEQELQVSVSVVYRLDLPK